MRNTTIRRVILLGALAILSILAVQSYWILRQLDLSENQFQDKVTISLLETAKLVAKASNVQLPTQDFIRQVASNYYVVNINNPFKPEDLEYYLQIKLEEAGVKEDFEYGVFDCSSNRMVFGKLIDYSDDKKSSLLAEPLNAHKESGYLYYFGVRFPNRRATIISDMGLLLFFSFLMVVAVAFFIYSIFVILRQKQLSELQTDFINNMTHEFKTPISTINISTDVFAKNELIQADPRLLRYTQIIKQQTQRLNNQVEKVLQIAGIERDDFGLNEEKLDFHELVREILPGIEIKIDEAKGKLENHLDATKSVVRADKLHLTNILHNLVDNAVKYCKVPPMIVFSTKSDGDQLVFSIKDNGIGIPKEFQARIFDKFYRVPTGNVHNVKGFGLGLFYVKNICKEHKWKLSLDSESEIGTTISISMKLDD
jgi:two-component system, OmpR family, phosphate regulon sensor histidine kinase PhoR